MRFLFSLLFLCLMVCPAVAKNTKPPTAQSVAPSSQDDSRYITGIAHISGVAAVVNGEMISFHDLQMQSRPEIMKARISKDDPLANKKVSEIEKKILDSMIIDTLAAKEAEHFKLSASDADVNEEIDKIIKSNKITKELLEASLKAQGLSLDFLKSRIRRNLTNTKLMNLMVTHKVVVPDTEIEKYYDAHQNLFYKNKKVGLSLIIFAPKDSSIAASVASQIKSGSLSFEDAAKKYSVGPKSEEGGSMGVVEWEKLHLAWREALKGVPVGGVTNPFPIEEVVGVLRLDSENKGELKTFKEASPEAEQLLKEPLLKQRFKEYTDQLRAKAVVDVRI